MLKMLLEVNALYWEKKMKVVSENKRDFLNSENNDMYLACHRHCSTANDSGENVSVGCLFIAEGLLPEL